MKRILFLFLFIAITLFSKAQMQNLFEMSRGELKYSKILFDQNSLWGYFYLYELDKMKDSTKMEYIVLDKNLNKINNGYFYEKKYPNKGIISYYNDYSNCIYLGDKLVLDILLKSMDQNTIYNSNRVISLKDNTVSEEFLLQGNQFTSLPEKELDYKGRLDSLQNQIFVDPIYGEGKSGYLVRSFNSYNQENEKLIKFYSENREFCWQYVFDSIPRKKKYSINTKHVTISYLFMDSVSIYFKEFHAPDSIYGQFKIIALDLKTGLKKAEGCLTSDFIPNYQDIRVKRMNDTIAVYGTYFEDIKTRGTTGYFRILLDKNCKVIENDCNTWANISTAEYTIKPNKKIKQTKRHFSTASMLMFKDGSMSVANQEYHTKSFLASILGLFTFNIINFLDLPYEKDLFFFNFDKDFNPSGITRVDMRKYIMNQTTLENYLFTQYHGNNSSAVVCFLNRTNTKGKIETELVINTIKNSEVKTERIPLTSSRKYSIIPNPAKDGYIMLNEYNKQDKYNEIRLEKLNN
jgi:hypothetical protein